MVRELADLVGMDDRPLRILEVSELAGRLGVVLHGAPDDRGLSSPRRGDVDDLPDARDVRRERRRDHAAGRPRHDPVEHLGNVTLRLRVPRDLGARRVGHQEEDALRGDRREAREVGLAPVDGGVVELPVARVDDRAIRGLDRDADRVGDAVTHVIGVALDRADGERAARRDLVERGTVGELVLA